MNFALSSNIRHIFILGAGASVDYGLPTWKELDNLIKTKIENDKNDQYKYRKEMLDWLNKIGEDGKYKTIDECIMLESVSKDYHNNGHEIEDEIFKIIKDVFEEVYRENGTGWIRQLNEIIKDNKNMGLENNIAFVDYNYDNVLDKNFLNFDYLPTKYKLFNFKDRLGILSKVEISCLYPYGYFPSEYNSPYIHKEAETIKSNNKAFIDTVSCYESKRHNIATYNLAQKMFLYILGLGGGLEINLNNINFQNKISEIHITIKNKEKGDQIINFLSDKFKIPLTEIKVYKDCGDLIGNCFIPKTKPL